MSAQTPTSGCVCIYKLLSAGIGSTNTVLVTHGNADSDADGLPDAWETVHLLNPFSSSGADGATGDPDGDAFDNYSEFVAGTNPRNKASLLKIVEAATGGQTITWFSVSGKVYQVVSATNVPSAFTPISGNLTATNTTTAHTDTNLPGPRRFYRVQIIP